MPKKEMIFKTSKIHEKSPSVVRRAKFAIQLPKPKDKRNYRMPESKLLKTSFHISEGMQGYEKVMLRHGVSNHLRRKIYDQTFCHADYFQTKYADYK